MSALRISPLTDLDALSRLYADPYIARVGRDGAPAQPVLHPLASYIGAYVDGSFVGAFLSVRYTAMEREVHSLLTRKAVRYSRRLGALFINHLFADPVACRLTAYVVQGLEAARNFCVRLGFEQEGIRRDAVRINGELRGVYCMGLTRRAWES